MTEMTYTAAQEHAQAIHPNMFARLNEYTQNWDFVLTTTHTEKYSLGLQYQNTPAWEAFNTYASDGSALMEWAENQGYRYDPIEIVAEYYNLHVERETYLIEQVDVSLAEAGVHSYGELFGAADEFSSYPQDKKNVIWGLIAKARKDASELAHAKFGERYTELDKIRDPS